MGLWNCSVLDPTTRCSPNEHVWDVELGNGRRVESRGISWDSLGKPGPATTAMVVGLLNPQSYRDCRTWPPMLVILSSLITTAAPLRSGSFSSSAGTVRAIT